MRFFGSKIFDGEYINGEKTGMIMLFDGNYVCEGLYISGKRNGKGKEYCENELVFEGEFLNDKRWKGTGKEYNNDNKLIYEGEYLNEKL